MTQITWRQENVPAGMAVKQVYGLLFSKDGRVLLTVDGQKHSLPGGHPEPQDIDDAAVLRREVDEEVNLSIGAPVPIGFQQVDEEDGTAPYAQLRMVATITEIRPRRADPANGRTYRRLLTSPALAVDLLNWGEVGRRQVERAAAVAMEQLGVRLNAASDEWI